MEVEKMITTLENDDIQCILLQFCDVGGSLQSITIPAARFPDVAKNGLQLNQPMSQLFANNKHGDLYLSIDFSTYARIPWLAGEHGNAARFLCDIHSVGTKPYKNDPRYILKYAVSQAREMGFEYNLGLGLEFSIFQKDNASTREGHIDSKNSNKDADLMFLFEQELVSALRKMGIYINSLQKNNTQQYKISTTASDALMTADTVLTIKSAAKGIAAQYDMHVTFMPKPDSDTVGNRMYIQQELISRENDANALTDDEDEHRLSRIARNVIAGQLTHARALTALTCPTVNSYKRLASDNTVSRHINWGIGERSTLMSVQYNASAADVAVLIELQNADPSANPYLVFAALLAAGLDGIKRNIMPQKPFESDPHDPNAEITLQKLPESLNEALEDLKNNRVILKSLGSDMSKKFISLKTKECDDYRLFVSKWERDTYFDHC